MSGTVNIPYPAEIYVLPRRRRSWRTRLIVLGMAALVILGLAWPHRAQPQPVKAKPVAAVTHRPAKPARAAVTVAVGTVVYACAVPPKPAKKR